MKSNSEHVLHDLSIWHTVLVCSQTNVSEFPNFKVVKWRHHGQLKEYGLHFNAKGILN